MTTLPAYCHPAAFDSFIGELPNIDEGGSLFRAAWAIARHEYPEADVAEGEETIRRLASTVQQRVRSRNHDAVIAHLHDVLFDVYGLHGDNENYYDPRNSYLPQVLQRRCGLPIALTLIYKTTADLLGVTVYGVNAPGHFLAEVVPGDGGGTRMYVDPYFGGAVLTPAEAHQRIEQSTGQTVAPAASLLARATHEQWLKRMLNNLQATFAASGRERDLFAMQELQQLLL